MTKIQSEWTDVLFVEHWNWNQFALIEILLFFCVAVFLLIIFATSCGPLHTQTSGIFGFLLNSSVNYMFTASFIFGLLLLKSSSCWEVSHLFCTNKNQKDLTRFYFVGLFSFLLLFNWFLHIFRSFTTLLLTFIFKSKKEIECAASWCTCSVRLGEDTCVFSVTACLSAAATALLVIARTQRADRHTLCYLVCECKRRVAEVRYDLIMENSPWHRSQRAQELWHHSEKYSCCAGFCHKTPVDEAQPWQTAKRGRAGKRGMDGGRW